MNAIKATVMQGRLELKVPLDWPDGTEVLIEPTMAPLEKIGIDESEWRDDPTLCTRHMKMHRQARAG